MTPTTLRPKLSWPVPTYLLFVVIGLILGAIAPLPWFGSPVSDLLLPVGVILLFAGLALCVAALNVMRKAGTTVLPEQRSTHLITSGPFGISRNPIYVGFTAIVAGLALVLGNLWLLAGAILAAIIVDRLVIRGEERMLQERFGKKYLDYSRKVRRWI